MQTFFEEEISKLKRRVIKQFNLVTNQIESALHIIEVQTDDEIENIQKNEQKIDKLDVKIDKLCQKIFALGQPVASDLRLIMSSLRINTELERIGDLAYRFTQSNDTIRQFPNLLQKFKIKEFLAECIELSKRITDCYTTFDIELSNNVILTCENLKISCKASFEDVISEMTNNHEVIIVATEMIQRLRDIEGIVRHVQNVAEAIVFINKGKIVKHGAAAEIMKSEIINPNAT